MNTQPAIPRPRRHRAPAFMLIELLVYIGSLFVILGFGYMALYRATDNSTALRHSAEDIVIALRTGENWRADIRNSTGPIRVEPADPDGQGQLVRLPGPRGEVDYLFSTNTVLRRLGNAPWMPVLENVKTSAMNPDPRQTVVAWRWELELQTRSKTLTRTRPLFTFIAVPATAPTP